MSTVRASNVHGATSTKTWFASSLSTSAVVGTTGGASASARGSVTVANMPGLSRMSGLANAMRTLVRRVSGSSTSLTNSTSPLNISPG